MMTAAGVLPKTLSFMIKCEPIRRQLAYDTVCYTVEFKVSACYVFRKKRRKFITIIVIPCFIPLSLPPILSVLKTLILITIIVEDLFFMMR